MTVASTPAEGQRVEAQWAELRYIDSWPCCPKRKAAVIAFFNHTDAGRVEDTFHVPYASAYCSGMPFRHQMAVCVRRADIPRTGRCDAAAATWHSVGTGARGDATWNSAETGARARYAKHSKLGVVATYMRYVA